MQAMQNSHSVTTITSNASNLRGIDDPIRKAQLQSYMKKKQEQLKLNQGNLQFGASTENVGFRQFNTATGRLSKDEKALSYRSKENQLGNIVENSQGQFNMNQMRNYELSSVAQSQQNTATFNNSQYNKQGFENMHSSSSNMQPVGQT